MKPFVSVLVPCRDEAEHIAGCLESLLGTTYPQDRMEVLVLDGQSGDSTSEIAAAIAAGDSRVRVLENEGRYAAAALNLGIREARGEVILRADAHAIYPQAYITALVDLLEQEEADNVGCVLETVPANSGVVATAIAVALSHQAGVGNASFRTGTEQVCEVDTVPFGCWRREVFEQVGLFDEELVRNQDDAFNHRLRKAGGRLLLTPHIRVRYVARSTFFALACMYWQYGLFKPLAVRKVGHVPTLRQLIPAGFVAALLAGGGLGVVSWVPLAALLVMYGVCLLLAATQCVVCKRIPWGGMPALILAFSILHLSYGCGYWCGMPRAIRP